MGAIIKASGTSASPAITSSIAHAAEAAQKCVSAAGISIDDVDVLINAGVYRDNNMVEPAMSALISRELGLGLDYIKHPTRKTAFTFDLMNGGAGMLNAIQVASAYLATGEAEHVLVVASDAHPSNRRVDGFPYASVGGALLLARGEAGQGFGRVQVTTSSGSSAGLTGHLQLGSATPNGRERISVERDAGFEQQALELAVQAAKKHARDEQLSLAEATLISSQLSASFASTLARRLEAAGGVTVEGLDGDPHTSALAFAYGARPSGTGPLLFVAVGAGLTAACAVYRP